MWVLNEVKVGDYIKVEIINKRGDRNLDGMNVSGRIRELVPDHSFARLDNGWCCHTKDRLVEHIPSEKLVD